MRSGQGPIKPGESDSITIIVDTLSKDPGKLTTGARIYTNDPNVRNAVLLIKARIVAEE